MCHFVRNDGKSKFLRLLNFGPTVRHWRLYIGILVLISFILNLHFGVFCFCEMNLSLMNDNCSFILLSFCLCLIFPVSQMSAGAYSYLVFATVCFSVAIYVYLIIPETKNKTFMEISQMFSRKQPVLDTQGLILGDQLQLKKMNGYGGLEQTSLDFDSSS